MSMPVLSVLLLIASAGFDVQKLPVQSGDLIFVGPSDTSHMANIYVQSGCTLTVHSSSANKPDISITLQNSISAYDVLDVDGDRSPEIIAISGSKILCYKLPVEGTQEVPRELFSLKTLYAEPARQPYPCVLTVELNGRLVLALPCENSLEIRALNGGQIASYPTGQGTPRSVSFGRPFETWDSTSSRFMGIKNDFGKGVNHRIDYELLNPTTDLPIGELYSQKTSRRYLRLNIGAAVAFPLTTRADSQDQVIYSRHPTEEFRSIIRIGRAKENGKESIDETDLSPPREYPGIVMPQFLPDFNGDGYTDLLLWSAQQPAMSVDAITRAVTGQTWPVAISVYLYSPQKNRYEPKAATRITVPVPVQWFLSGDLPVKSPCAIDFNGDGRTDFAGATSDNSYSIWLMTNKGFPEVPDFSTTFDEPIKDIAFIADLAGNGRSALGLRSQNNLYVLRPIM